MACAFARAWVAAAVLLGGCTSADRVPTVAFAGPQGMALAGANWNRLFVANNGTDSVQVVNLTSDLNTLDMVPSAARFFPLYIPAGPNPSELAATHDGRYVVILDVVTSSLRVIDVDNLALLRDAGGVPLSVPLGPREAQPSGVIGSPLACTPSEAGATDTCEGRVYVGLRGLGAIVAVDVRRGGDGSVALKVDSFHRVGGAPLKLAAHPTKPVVFATDAEAADLIQLEVDTGQINRIALGDSGGPVVVSGDGNYVVVGRPEQRDLIILASKSGADAASFDLAARDADPVYTPQPVCLQSCLTIAPDVCADAHDADQAVCALKNGLGAGLVQPYQNLFLGVIPAQLASLSHTLTGRSVVEPCVNPDNSHTPVGFSEAVAVVTLEGSVYFVGLATDATPPVFAPRLLEASRCSPAKLTRLAGSVGAARDFLTTCPPFPAGRSRFQCIADPTDGAGVVGVLRGNANGQQWHFTWEGVIAGGDRSNGGGLIDDQGRFGDVELALGGLPIVTETFDDLGRPVSRGDILEILTQPLGTPACQNAQQQTLSRCNLERHIKAIDPGDANSQAWLVLDKKLEPACFHSGGAIAYRIRASEAFIATASDATGNTTLVGATRVGLGGSITPGAAFFAVRSDLHTNAGADACTRFTATDPNVLSPVIAKRDASLGFAVSDAFAAARTGLDFDATGAPLGTVGKLPGGVAISRQVTLPDKSVLKPMLFVSYAGSDSLLVSVPFDISNLQSNDITNKILR